MSKANILVVDDEAEIREGLELLLTSEGYRVDLAGSAETGLAALEAKPYDLLLVDVSLPDLNGLDVLSRLRATSDVPVIMLSGRTDEADRVAGLESGADDYVVKPFYPRELAARVRSLLRRSGARTRPSVLDFDEHVRRSLSGLRRRPFFQSLHLADSQPRFFLLPDRILVRLHHFRAVVIHQHPPAIDPDDAFADLDR